MIITELFENANQPMAEVAGPEKCWPGHRKVGTKPGTGKYAGKRVNDCKKIDEQGVPEAMQPSDVPPGMRQRLTMRDVEAERPAGAFRFRVTFPDGHANDYMTFDAAKSAADREQGRISRLSETQKTAAKGTRGGNPRIDRILKMLRANNPQAQNDLEALILDFRGQQGQDREDILRIDVENDVQEADIDRLEQMLALLKQRKGSAAVTEDDQDDLRDFLARGGKIQQEPGRMPRLGARLRRQGSRHIGQGSEPRAGQLTGRGANVNVRSGKPVVAAESLQPGEYHVATVTLDDGTVKRVRITSDEGFRDSIVKHFARQDREVMDIDMDYAVRSDLEEAKKKPVPTNPELWGRAKSAARAKFDVYPSAYANGWAAKWYKSKGGGWRMGKPKKK